MNNEDKYGALTPGHLACPGCGATLAMNWVLSELGSRSVVALPASCFSIISGAFPHFPLRVNLVHTAFETAAAIATGLKAGLEATGRPDEAVAATVKPVLYTALAGAGVVTVMLWFNLFTVNIAGLEVPGVSEQALLTWTS